MYIICIILISQTFKISETSETLRRDGADGQQTLRPGPCGAGTRPRHLLRVQSSLQVSRVLGLSIAVAMCHR